MPGTAELGTDTVETSTSTDISTGVTGGGDQTVDTGSFQDTDQQVSTQGADETQLETVDLEDRDAEPFADSMPNELRTAISQNPQLAPHIQRLWDRLSSYSSIFSTPREAREFRDMFPGGMDDARAITDKAGELDRSNELLYSGDPQAQSEVLQPMFDDNPDAFMGIMKTSADIVAQRNPQLYQQFTGEIVGKQLQVERFGNHLEWMSGTLQKLGSTDPKEKEAAINELANQTATLVKWAQNKGYVGKERDLGRETGTRVDPKMSALEKENKNLREGQWNQFSSTVNTTVKPQIESVIRKFVEPSMKGVPEKQRKATTDMLVNQARMELETRLKADQVYQNQYRVWAGGKSIPRSDDAVKFIVGRANAHVKAVVKQILTPWATNFVADKNATADKIKETGTRVDVTGGNNTAGRVSKVKLTQDEANSMKPEDILGWARGKYDRQNAGR